MTKFKVLVKKVAGVEAGNVITNDQLAGLDVESLVANGFLQEIKEAPKKKSEDEEYWQFN